MEKLFALTIGDVEIKPPDALVQGGLPEAFSIGSSLVTLAFTIIIIIAFFLLLWGGIKWITSGGEKTKVDSARKTITYTIIGLILVFLSFFIVNLITGLFGVPSVDMEPRNSQEGLWGCFDNKDDPNLTPGCAKYSPGNDPSTPRAWYSNKLTCTVACR